MRPSLLWGGVLWAGLLSGCQGCGAAQPRTQASATAASNQVAPDAQDTRAASTGNRASQAQPTRGAGPDGLPPHLALSGEATRTGIQPVLQNRDGERVRIRSRLTLERAAGQGDGFVPVPNTTLSLRDDCETPPPDCFALVPGAELRAPPWRGAEGDAQCGCHDDNCKRVPDGRYRFVVEGCESPHRVTGKTFELSAASLR